MLRLVVHDPDGDARRFDDVVTAVAALIPRVEITEARDAVIPGEGAVACISAARRLWPREMAGVAGRGSRGSSGASVAAVGGSASVVADGRFAATIAARQSARYGSRRSS